MEEEKIFSWEAYEKPHKERKVDWYWALGIISITGAVLAFLFGNFLFGVFIILAVVVLIFFASQKPRKILHQITEEGFRFDGKLLPFDYLISFWLDEDGEWGKILLHTKHPISPIMTFYYEDKMLGDTIYEAMIEKVKEKHLVEPISHQIFEKLGL